MDKEITTWAEAESAMESIYTFLVKADIENSRKPLRETPFDIYIEEEVKRARKVLSRLHDRRIGDERDAIRKERAESPVNGGVYSPV